MNKTRYHPRSDLIAHHADTAVPTPRALTEQERRVVAELARGHSNRQIARELALSEHTIKFHLKNVFNKLGVRSRTQVILHSASALSRPVAAFASAAVSGAAAAAP